MRTAFFAHDLRTRHNDRSALRHEAFHLKHARRARGTRPDYKSWHPPRALPPVPTFDSDVFNMLSTSATFVAVLAIAASAQAASTKRAPVPRLFNVLVGQNTTLGVRSRVIFPAFGVNHMRRELPSSAPTPSTSL